MSDHLPATKSPQSLPDVRGADAIATRQQANEARVELLRRQQLAVQQMSAVKAEMERRRAEVEADFERQRDEIAAVMGPMRAELAKMTEVLHTVDLYLGRSEEMTLLRDGQPAEASEPIVVRQRVLAADEESLVLLDSGGVDARRMHAFLDWIAASPANTAQLLPEPKCVVAVVPTAHERDYGDPWSNAAMAEANAQTHWLLRNGEQLWVMTTDFTAGATLVPRHDEFIGFFQETDWRGHKTGHTLVPGSDAWLKADQAADARKRHYMKIGMILQGVLDRTDVFAPLPEGGVNILTAAQSELQQVRFINELDMVLSDGRETFRDWQKRLNASLQPGMRIVGSFIRYSDSGFNRLYETGDQWTRGHHPRIHPGNAEYPPSNVPLLVEGRNRDGDLVIRYRRTEQIEKRSQPVPDRPGWVYTTPMPVDAKNRASCVVRSDDRWILPYDLAAIDDLNYHLNNREARKDYQNMVPVIRAALKAKQAERDAEEPFRTLIAGTLAQQHGMDLADVEALLPDVVDRWKVGNKWARPLTGDDAHEGKALRGVLAEFAATIRSKAGTALPQPVEDAACAQFGGRLLAVLAKRDGSYLAVARSDGDDPWGDGWVDTMPISKTGRSGVVTMWTEIPARTLSRATVAWQHPDWSAFRQVDPSVRLTGPELAAGIEFVVRHCAEHGFNLVAVTGSLLNDYESTPSKSIDAVVRRADSESLTSYRVRWARRDGQVTFTWSGRARQAERYSTTVHVDGVAYTGNMPWIEPSDHYANELWRPRLVWIDVDQFNAWRADVDAAEQARREAQAAWDAEHALWCAWRDRHDEAFEQYLRDQMHTRFIDEYGPEAEDLFDNWLSGQKLVQYHRAVNNLMDGPRNWRTIAGRTVADVAGTRTVPAEVATYRFPPIEPDEAQ